MWEPHTAEVKGHHLNCFPAKGKRGGNGVYVLILYKGVTGKDGRELHSNQPIHKSKSFTLAFWFCWVAGPTRWWQAEVLPSLDSQTQPTPLLTSLLWHQTFLHFTVIVLRKCETEIHNILWRANSVSHKVKKSGHNDGETISCECLC